MDYLRKRIGGSLPGIALLLGLLVLWEASVRLGWVVTPTWPAFSTVAYTFWTDLTNGVYLSTFGPSMQRLFIGYIIAAVTAVAAGIAMGIWPRVYATFEPLVELLRPIPSPAYLPMAIIFLGIDDVMKIFMVAFASFFPILLNTVTGVRTVDAVLLDTGRTFGLRKFETTWRIVIPAAASYILTGMRISLAVALIVTVIAEMVAGNSGIGFFILSAQRSFLMPEMYAGVVALALVGFALNKGFVAIERRLLSWNEGWNVTA